MAPGFDGMRPLRSGCRAPEKAARELEKLRKKGHPVAPVILEGRTIARTFWGKAWCDNLESYPDYDNRLPRGRTYVRHGAVIDLQIERWRSGDGQRVEIYRVKIRQHPARQRCGGRSARIAREHRLPDRTAARPVLHGVMERICCQARPVPQAGGHPVLLHLPGRSLDVQARCRRALWRRCPARCEARASVHPARRRSHGSHRRGRRRSTNDPKRRRAGTHSCR